MIHADVIINLNKILFQNSSQMGLLEPFRNFYFQTQMLQNVFKNKIACWYFSSGVGSAVVQAVSEELSALLYGFEPRADTDAGSVISVTTSSHFSYSSPSLAAAEGQAVLILLPFWVRFG